MVATSNHQSAMLTSAGDDRYVKVRLGFIPDGFWPEEIPFDVELRSKFSLLESLGMICLRYRSSCLALVSSSEAANDVKGTCLRFFTDAANILANHSQKKEPPRTEMLMPLSALRSCGDICRNSLA